MTQVLRIGGVFFRSKDAAATAKWYQTHLGLPIEDFGGATLGARDHEAVWAPFAADTDYFGPTEQPLMVNYVVADLDAVLESLRAEGVEVDDRVEDSEIGRFGWAVDGDGRRFELWQPPAGEYPG
jgi:predicted enzyme related to lactoylglutathione lyase